MPYYMVTGLSKCMTVHIARDIKGNEKITLQAAQVAEWFG
jgi:hypothetical protein